MEILSSVVVNYHSAEDRAVVHCTDCNNLTSLKGAPEKVGGDFECVRCYKLKDIEGCPREVGGSFGCSECEIGIYYTADDIKEHCKVFGKIKI